MARSHQKNFDLCSEPHCREQAAYDVRGTTPLGHSWADRLCALHAAPWLELGRNNVVVNRLKPREPQP